MLGTILYGLALFSPSIIGQMGFSPVKSQLLSVGPFAAGFFRRCLFLSCFLLQWLYFTLQPRWLTNHVLSSLIVTLLSAYFSDKYQNRSILIILALILCVIGFSMNLRKYTIRSPLSPSAHVTKFFLRVAASPNHIHIIIFVDQIHRHKRQICCVRLSLLHHPRHICCNPYPLCMDGQ